MLVLLTSFFQLFLTLSRSLSSSDIRAFFALSLPHIHTLSLSQTLSQMEMLVSALKEANDVHARAAREGGKHFGGGKKKEMEMAREQTEKRESFCVWEEKDGNPKGGCLMPMGFLALISGTKLGESELNFFCIPRESERERE